MLSTDPADVLETPPRLAAILDLVRLDALRYRGGTHPRSEVRTFGGEVVAQALLAAGRTVPRDRAVHSAHAHFLRGGDPGRPITYRVEVLRDGGSFSTRRVEAEQGGQLIFQLSTSYQLPESGFEHRPARPAAPDPGQLPSAVEAFADAHPDDLMWLKDIESRRSLELRFPEELPRLATRQGRQVPPRQRVWLRVTDPLPDDPQVHRAALAYASDLLLLSAALPPHRRVINDGGHFASLDHAVWFHAPHRMDEWLLYEQQSPWAGGGRALCHGQLFDRAGTLVASTVQEGLLRAPASDDGPPPAHP